MGKIAWCVFGIVLSGCGDDNHGGPDAAVDGAVDAPDHGAPSTTYPPFAVDMPTIQNRGGPVLQNMTIVTVTWSSDTEAARDEALADALGASNYWHTLTSEYGIGPTTSTAVDHVQITAAPPTMISRSQVQDLIMTNTTNGSWPAPTDSTLYLIYTAPTTTVLENGMSVCNRYSADQGELMNGGVHFTFGIVFGCSNFNHQESATFVFADVATDPFSQSNPTYQDYDADHLAWTFFTYFTHTIGQACQTDPPFTDAEAGFQYTVARGWSNSSAQAGHNPCVPRPVLPYFNVTLFREQEDTINVDASSIGRGMLQTKGIRAQVGQPRIFQVGFFTDAPTPSPITISANVPTNLSAPFGQPTQMNGTATVDIDKTSGTNGEKAYVTVTPTAFNAMGVIYMEVSSAIGTGSHNTMPILIGQ